MRDRDDGTGILREVVFEPLHALGIEVVRRFVQKQQVVPLKQCLTKRDATAFAAGELLDGRIRRGQSHRVHRHFEMPIQVVRIGLVDPGLNAFHLVGELLEVGVGVAHLLADVFLFLQ